MNAHQIRAAVQWNIAKDQKAYDAEDHHQGAIHSTNIWQGKVLLRQMGERY